MKKNKQFQLKRTLMPAINLQAQIYTTENIVKSALAN